MKKLLIIYPDLVNANTGGRIIDYQFIDVLRKSDNLELSYIQNKDLPSSSIIAYNLFFLFHISLFYKYDYVFVNSRLYPRLYLPFSLLRLLRCKTRLITYHHHYNFMTQEGISEKIHKYFELSFLRKMYRIIIPSPYAKAITEKLLPQKAITYIEIGFEQRREEIIRENNNTFLFVGTLEQRKGIQYILDVAKIFKQKGVGAYFRIVGNQKYTQYVNELKSFVVKEGLQESVTFLGRLTDEELNAEYNNASVFLFPSLHEGYGMVLIEAMSYSLPVVAFNNSAIPYTIVDGQNGLMAENMNAEDLAMKAMALTSDRVLYSEISHQAFIYSQSKPTREAMVDEMKQFVQTL